MSSTRKPSTRRLAGANQAKRRRRRHLSPAQAAIAAAVIGAAATVIAAAFGVFAKTPAPPIPHSAFAVSSRPSPTPVPTGPLIPGDNSTFVADVTYPDGSTITEGQPFEKRWEIKNTGTVLWAGRYLVADGTSKGSCTYPSRVRIPTTYPGQDVTISVPVTASDSLGLCFTTWKMETGNGTLYFPDELGIWFSVNVIIGLR